jgi:ferredoxin
MDPFLRRRVEQYDGWLREGSISYSSKVIPVRESFRPKEWVLPTEQVLEVLQGADSIAVQDCECRTHYRRCDSPLEVCLLLNEVGDRLVERGEARRIDLREADRVLKQANESGLVHLGLYMPDHRLFALCSCCPCCCHDLQIVKELDRRDLMIHSDYIAVMNPDDCTHCGRCVERCSFEARSMQDGFLVYAAGACVGCGLCVTHCPSEAITMELR